MEGWLGRGALEEAVGEAQALLSDSVPGELQAGGRNGCRTAATGGVFVGKT